ncbi:MAG: hypothetical protein KAT28_01695 [Candidatus Aenigmarchaeota archaeon]|nr:hypothetical protein [Candidatus Aenigmarchaeota archaeon]
MNFINEISNNLNKINPAELTDIYGALYANNSSCAIYMDGQVGGRSLEGLKIGTHDLSPLVEKYMIYCAGDSHSPGRTITEIFDNMGKVCKKCNYLCASGTGKSDDPYRNLTELAGNNKSDILLNLITSYPDSPMGNIIQEQDGNVLELKGRKSNNNKNGDYIKEGLLEDELELAITELTSVISRGISQEIEPNEFYEYYKNTIDEIKTTQYNIGELQGTEEYKALLENLIDPVKSVFSCGRSVDNDILKMSNIRLGHVRPLTMNLLGIDPNAVLRIGANRNYVIGESCTPNMDENSILLCVSKSGTGKIEKYLGDAHKIGAECFLVTEEGSAENAKTLKLDTHNFYTDSCFLLSTILTDLGYKLIDEGVEVNEAVLKALHVKDKI